MRKILVLAIILSCLLPLVAQDIWSFRNHSSGGALVDEADLAFDPIEINYLKGTTLFTNLSNMNGSDQIFKNSGSQHLLFGFVSDNCRISKNLNRALIMKYYDYQTPGAYSFMANPDMDNISASGEYNYLWESYSDNNGNYLYDELRSISQNYNSMSYYKGLDFYATLGYKLKRNQRMGIKFGFLQSESGNNRSSKPLLDFATDAPSCDRSDLIQNLPGTDPFVSEFSSLYEDKGDFDTKIEASSFYTELAYGKDMGYYQLSGGIIVNILDDKTKTQDLANSKRYIDGIMTQLESESYENEINSKGLYSALKLGLRETKVSAAERINEGFSVLDFQLGLYGTETDESETSESAYKNFSTTHDRYKNTMLENNENSGFDIHVGYRFQYPLNNRTFLGFGSSYYYLDMETEGDFDYQVSSVDSSFTSFDDAWDETEVTSWAISGKTKHAESKAVWKLPVGLEYWFTSNNQWAMRFGSVFTHTTINSSRAYNPDNVEPMTTTFFTPDSDPLIIVAPNTYVIESEQQKSISSAATYSYGLGYKPNKNLQIDLMGIFETANTDIWNSSFFRNLRLSFTLKM